MSIDYIKLYADLIAIKMGTLFRIMKGDIVRYKHKFSPAIIFQIYDTLHYLSF